MSPKVIVGRTECQNLDEASFRERFKNAFELDETLTPEIYYQILLDVEFNEQKALWRVVYRIKKPGQFLVPGFLHRPLSNGSEACSADRPIFSPSKTTPRAAPNVIESSSFGGSLVISDDDEDEDIQPVKKRRAHILPIRSTTLLHSSRSAKKQRSRTGPKIAAQLKSARYSQSTSTLGSSGEESDLFLSNLTKRKSQNSEGGIAKTLGVSLSNTIESDSEDYATTSDTSDDQPSPKHKKKPSLQSPTRRGNQNEMVLKHRMKTMATPWLHMLARPFFPTTLDEAPAGGLQPIEIEDRNDLDLNRYLKNTRARVWDHEPAKIDFKGSSIWQNKNGRHGYAAVDIDGVTYETGDCVIVRSTEPHSSKKSSKKNEASDNSDKLLNPWYARIIYLFEDEDGEKMAHFRWFHHGAETALKEMASPRELFLLTQCDDALLDCIYCKIKVTNKRADVLAIQNGTGIVELDLADKEEFFYRFHYHEENKQFTDVSIHEDIDTYIRHNGPHCDCCERLEEISRNQQTRIIGGTPDSGSHDKFDAFHRQGVDYYLNDFVYIFDDSFSPYRIGQIERIYLAHQSRHPITSKPRVTNQNLMVKVALYERYDKFHMKYYDEIQEGRAHKVRDERRLYKSHLTAKILVDQVDGKCYVRHKKDIENMEQWKDENDRWWVNEQVSNDVHPGGVIRQPDLSPLPSLNYAKQTERYLANQAKRRDNFLRNFEKLRGLDMFAGCGGLSNGIHQSGVAKTCWAVEFSEAGCVTLSKNAPDAKIYNLDANVFLDRAIRLENGEELSPLRDCHGNVIPEPPRKGEVEFIWGGPPCPGFSIANRCPKAEDIRNSLIVLFLSLLDFYRPKYFLLENVEAILTYRLGATQVSQHKTEGGIPKGMLKFILRAMTGLGYQAQFNVLQSAEYHTPQSRTRAIFWASQMGHRLPAFPEPQNIVPTSRQWTSNWHRLRRAAPHPTVTIGDALSDLPAFDWMNPHRVIKQTKEQRLEREDRRRRTTQYNCEEYTTFVGRDHQLYASQPISEYQRKLRDGVQMDELFNHVTLRWDERKSTVIEQVCNVPLRPNADHRNLPTELKPWSLSSPHSAASRNGFYPGRIGRLDMEGISGTCMTRMEPNGKNGKVLHPTQYRVITLREYARIMSYPDSFNFDLSKMRAIDVVRQVGNSVPPNLAREVVRPLLDVMMAKNERDQQGSRGLRIEEIHTPIQEIRSSMHKALATINENHTPRNMDARYRQGSKDDPITLD